MRDFFINSLEKVVNVLMVILIIGVVLSALASLFMAEGGIIMALAVLVGGGFYTILMGGIIYLGLGIYQNTKTTAEATQALLAKQS